MAKCVVSGSRFQFLSSESEQWQREGIITTETRAKILDRYEFVDAHERRRRVFMTALWALGTLLVGLGVLLLVSYNWHGLTATFKLSIIGGVMLGGYVAAMALDASGKNVLAEIACLFASLIYGVGIWQIAQIFHIAAYYPHGVLMWALGVLLLAVSLRTPIVHFLSAALLALWAWMEICRFGHLWLPLPFTDWVMLNGAWACPALAGFGWLSASWRGKSQAAAETIRCLYTVVFLAWLLLLPIALPIDSLVPGTAYYLTLGAVMFLVPQFRAPQSVSGTLTQVVGMFVMAVAFIPMSFHKSLHYLHRSMWVEDGFGFWCVLLAPGILVVGGWLFLLARCLCAPRTFAGAKALRGNAFFAIMALYGMFLPLLFYCIVSWQAVCEVYKVNTLPALALHNLLMFAFGIAFMHRGTRLGKGGLFGFGVLYFLIWTLCRYIDLFGDFGGMLGAAAVFFFCAAVLFGLSYFWFHNRKKRVSGAEVPVLKGGQE